MRTPPRHLALLVTVLVSTAACDRLRTNKYPAFDDARVERVGEPVTVITTNVHSIERETLRDGSVVQAMPVLMVRRRQPGIKWSSLSGNVSVPDVRDTSLNAGRRIYLVGEAKEGAPDSSGARRLEVSQTFSLKQMRPPGLAPGDIAERERAFLEKLDADSTWRAVPMLLVCLQSPVAARRAELDARCFHSGHRYRLEVGATEPRAVYPFRVENRNGALGIAVGLAGIATFVALEVID
jgi:hypothetical protein